MSALVSIIIRTHNAAAYLPALLKSIHLQDFKDWEIVAVVHNCTDASEQILSDAGARIVHYPSNRDFNYSHALNIGAEASSGKYLLNLSSHVEFARNDTLAKMVHHLEQEKLAAISVRRRFAGERFPHHEALEVTTSENFKGYGGLANYCGMIPKSLWHLHAFGEALPTVEDCAWAAYWLYQGHKTAFLQGHAVIYKNPNYTTYKLVRDRVFIALFITQHDPSSLLRELAGFTWNNARRYIGQSRLCLIRPIWVELAATWQLRRLSRSNKKQEVIREQMLRDYPGLSEYVETYLKHPAEPESSKAN
jgi:glycosyltransferase involved in cell wall biosynthesis